MKVASFDRFGLSAWRFVAVSATAAMVTGYAAWVVLGDVLGGTKGPAVAVISTLTFYSILSVPRRLLDSQRVAQARESVVLSAAATACLGVTGSRSRTVLILRSREGTVSEALTDAGRRILLGEPAELAVRAASGRIGSYSAVAALEAISEAGSKRYDPSDEETRGLASSSELSRETKLPAFLTVCFFAPIMLVLYSVFAHAFQALSLIELLGLEFIVLDISFYLSSGDKERD